MQYAYRAIIVFALRLCNYWLKFNETLWEPSIPKGDAHIVALFRPDTLTQSYDTWLVMQYAYRANVMEPSIPRGVAHISPCSGQTLTQSYGPWLVIQYAYRAIIVSTLLLCNYWLEFNGTLWEPLISRWDVHNLLPYSDQTIHYRVMALDYLCSMHIERYCYFFATAVLISTKVYGNHRYKKAIFTVL
jgi:hypothetical protein